MLIGAEHQEGQDRTLQKWGEAAVLRQKFLRGSLSSTFNGLNRAHPDYLG